MIGIITLFIAAIGGMIFANMIAYREERRREQRMLEKNKRKELGKKWYDD